MQHTHLCWIALALFCGSATQVGRADDKLRDELIAELSAMECPGALVGFSVGKEPPQVFCVGVADVKTKAPMERDFHMRIASVTKPILGTAVLLLATKESCRSTTPISKYVSDVPGRRQNHAATIGQQHERAVQLDREQGVPGRDRWRSEASLAG